MGNIIYWALKVCTAYFLATFSMLIIEKQEPMAQVQVQLYILDLSSTICLAIEIKFREVSSHYLLAKAETEARHPTCWIKNLVMNATKSLRIIRSHLKKCFKQYLWQSHFNYTFSAGWDSNMIEKIS